MTLNAAKRILVLGANGQVGCELARQASSLQHTVIFFNRHDLDLTSHDKIPSKIEAARADIVINAAAYTAVDLSESNADLAFNINALAVEKIAIECARAQIPLIHLSSDYVFDGTKGSPYTESDLTNPLGVYGHSKLKGEQLLQAAHDKHVILRTSWVFGASGHNFLKTILRVAESQHKISVVADQFGCPTPASNIAKTIYEICARLVDGVEPWGLFHLAGKTSRSWYDFALDIVDAASEIGLVDSEFSVEPISTLDYPTIANRPKDSRLSTRKLRTTFDFKLTGYKDAMRDVLFGIKNVR